MEEQKEDFLACGLGNIAPWQKGGSLPYCYILKKFKNWKRCRPIVSCRENPARVSLQVVAKGATLAIQLTDTIHHFDISSTHQVAEEFATDYAGEGDYLAAGFDMYEMYTALDHKNILEDAEYFLHILSQCCCEDRFYVEKGRKGKAHLGNPPSQAAYSASFKDIIIALEYELTHMIFRAGDKLLGQGLGAGMGGFMSPFGARVTCIVREHRWQQIIGRALHGPLRAVRHMQLYSVPLMHHFSNSSS